MCERLYYGTLFAYARSHCYINSVRHCYDATVNVNAFSFQQFNTVFAFSRFRNRKSASVPALVVIQDDLRGGGFDATLNRLVSSLRVCTVFVVDVFFVKDVNVKPLEAHLELSHVVEHRTDTEIGKISCG